MQFFIITQERRALLAGRLITDRNDQIEFLVRKLIPRLTAWFACFDAVTQNGARTMGLEAYGLEPGCHADMVILQAADAIEALRTRPARLQVIRRGRVIASTPRSTATLTLGEQQIEVDFAAPENRENRVRENRVRDGFSR